jgi:hypothetical protein
MEIKGLPNEEVLRRELNSVQSELHTALVVDSCHPSIDAKVAEA